MGSSTKLLFVEMVSLVLSLFLFSSIDAYPYRFGNLVQDGYPSYNQYNTLTHVKPSYQSLRSLQTITSTSPYQNPPALTSGSIVWQARQLTEYVKLTLRQLAKDPLASPYISRITSASECLTTIEDAIISIDTSIRLLENAEPEVLRLVDTAEAMQKYTDVETLVRVSADIVRQLGTLIPKLAPENPEVCGSSTEVSFAVLNKVAEVIEDVSNDQKLFLSERGRQELKTSAQVVRGVTKFVEQLGATFNGFNKESCVADKDTNTRAISAIRDMLLSLADMFQSFWGVTEAEGVRGKAAWVKDIVEAMNNSDLLDVGTPDCNRPGDTSLAANTLDDIADLIAEVGLETLAKQLGVEQLI